MKKETWKRTWTAPVMILKKTRRTQEVLQRLPQGQARCQGAGRDRGADQGAGRTNLLMIFLDPGVDPRAGTTTLLMIPQERLLASPPLLEQLAEGEEEEEGDPLTLHLVKSLLTFPQRPWAS